MIIEKEEVVSQRIFSAIRDTVRDIHPESIFDEDPCSAPFLFKSRDAKVWVRIFYQAMSDLTSAEMGSEITKLMVLMPKDASVYCFYPLIDPLQMRRIKPLHGRVVFFEYGNQADEAKTEIRVRKWVAGLEERKEPSAVNALPFVKKSPALFSRCARLSMAEIEDLAELGLRLRRA